MSDQRKQTRTMNMTAGSPTRLLILFAVPMLIGNIFQQMYNLVDSVIVGRFVGADALAAIGATSSVSFLFFALCSGVGNGGGIITAQQFGAGNEEKVKKAIINSAYILLSGSVVMGAIAFAVAEPSLRLMSTPDEIMKDAVLYMKMQCIGLPLVAVYNHVSSMLRALGDSRTPLYFLVFACVLNVFLDLLFVCVFGMGVLGAAVATILAQFVSGAGCLLYALKKNSYFQFEKRHFKPDKSLIWGSVRLGVPLSLQFSLIAVSGMGLQKVVNNFGPVVMAAFTATGRIEQLLHQPYGTMNTALSTYCSQNIGAGDLKRVRQGYHKSLIIMGIFTAVMVPVMQLGSTGIVSLFVGESEVIQYGAKALQITSWFYLFLGIINVTRGILNGVGDAVFAMINGLVEVVARIALPMILTLIPALGVWGIWWAVGLVWMVSAVSCLMRYYSWRKKNR